MPARTRTNAHKTGVADGSSNQSSAALSASDMSICGVWIDENSLAHIASAQPGGARAERSAPFRPFAWLSGELPPEALAPSIAQVVTISPLSGPGVFTQIAHADTIESYEALLAAAKRSAAPPVAADALRPFENQFLLQTRQRLFGELGFHELRRCQLDIETASAGEGHFSDAANPDDRILAIGLQFSSSPPTLPNVTPAIPTPSQASAESRQYLLVLEEPTDAAEKKLLQQFNDLLLAENPDTIEGHNIFKFDLDYLRQRARRHKIVCAWGRFGQKATFRNSRMKVAERMIDFSRCDIPGRAIIDTYMLVQLHDITTREMTSYGLKDSAVFFGITSEDAAESGSRTYIEGSKIQEVFRYDRTAFLAYLADDLRETKGLADLLLPTYFEQTRTFPILLQDATLRGTTTKIDLLFLEEYYHACQACPAPVEMAAFAGGYTRSFKEGVYKNVLHFDVASLYPSLLLGIGQNPAGDSLGVFIPMLRRLREYRLKYKQLARTTPDARLRAEYQARQASFKILINSLYGYLGFSGARFGDGALAAEVTRRGRELLQTLIDTLAAEGCDILEADTDGIYLASEKYFSNPAELLAKAQSVLPEGIDLEHDGSYAAMFCYKSKNYALLENRAADKPGAGEGAPGKIIIRGSALRSRGIEPYLKKLSDTLIRYLLGATPQSPLILLEDYRRRLTAVGRDLRAPDALPVEELAKSEILSQNPDAYERFIAEGGKPRRASAEVALQMTPRPRMGERITYYITAKAKGKTADWQRARSVVNYNPTQAPYDPAYYQEKLDDWLERYAPFLGNEAKRVAAEAPGAQGELF